MNNNRNKHMKNDRKENKYNIAIVFHDQNLSGGSRALIELLERWIEDDSLSLICILPKKSGEVIEKLKEMHVEFLTYPYWQIVRKGTESKFCILKKYFQVAISYITSCFFAIFTLKKYNPNIIYSNTSVIFEGVWLSKILKVKHIWHIREVLDDKHLVVSLLPKDFHYHYVVNNANVLIMISKLVMAEYSKYYSNARRIILYDDVSPKYIFKEKMAWKKNKYNFLVAGNISPGKGQHVVIKALNEIIKKDIACNLYVAGVCDKANMEYMHEIQVAIDAYKLNDKVHFLGNVDNMNHLREHMGIGIVAAKNEAFGRVTVEGMLAGMIIIGAKDGGTAELINDSENGFLFPVDDYIALTEKILTVINMDEKEIEKIRCRAMMSAKTYAGGNCALKVAEEMRRLVDRE